MDYCKAAVLVAEKLRADYQLILNNGSQGPQRLAEEGRTGPVQEDEEAVGVDVSRRGIHFICGDVLDPPFEPELFGLVVDKGDQNAS